MRNPGDGHGFHSQTRWRTPKHGRGNGDAAGGTWLIGQIRVQRNHRKTPVRAVAAFARDCADQTLMPLLRVAGTWS